MGGCTDNPCVRGCICFFRWVPVVLILAVIVWAYYAYVVQLCFFDIFVVDAGHCLFQFYLTSEIRRDMEMAADDTECRQILERFVRLNQIPVTNLSFDGSKLSFLSLIEFLKNLSFSNNFNVHFSNTVLLLFSLCLLLLLLIFFVHKKKVSERLAFDNLQALVIVINVCV
ncbi:unnamed protein product [Anisakis simplex]|uniref:CTL-like protein n=1 Tax=Anisakis simplex TaxID=6269 RepID=A0A0M3J3B5_ANISI|nr:unnamed protein product [Anisakis simplex]